jgi:hypothetical protein
MAVQDDIRRLSEMQGIYLGLNLYGACMAWYEGRLQQANDGSWIFRSSSRDGTIVAFTLPPVGQNWASQESPVEGLTVFWQFTAVVSPQGTTVTVGQMQLRQQLPQGITN